MTIEIRPTSDGNLLLTNKNECKSNILFDPIDGKLGFVPESTDNQLENQSIIGECQAVLGVLTEGETSALFVVTQWNEIAKHPLDKVSLLF